MPDSIPGFSSHMAAAKAGCPICKTPLEALRADHADPGWKNHCTVYGCTGALAYTINYETATKPTKPIHKIVREEVAPSPPVHENWEFIVNLYKWMTVEGNVVSIKELPEKEFVDSVRALIRANFSKVSSKMAWIKGLPTFGAPYAYPKEALAVGAKDAREKIEEFYESAVEREWVTPGSG